MLLFLNDILNEILEQKAFGVLAAGANVCSNVVLVTFLLRYNTVPKVNLQKKGLILVYISEESSQTW